MNRVCVVDYGIGNVASVVAAFDRIEIKCSSLQNPEDLPSNTHLVLPGVGSYAAAMESLEVQGWIEPLLEFANSGKPILGICLGMQILASGSFEGAERPSNDLKTNAFTLSETEQLTLAQDLVPGLGLIAGPVMSLKSIGCQNRIPHTGWNTVCVVNDSSLLRGIPNEFDMYFVHSYALEETNPAMIASTAYGEKFSAIVQKGNVMGTQFHPEKSSRHGLVLLKNFIESYE